MWKVNEKKKRLIKKYGITAGLPLFDSVLPSSNLPDWIWNGTEMKAEVYEKLSEHYKVKGMMEYIETVIKLGGNATDNEVEASSNLRPNIITARRNNLMEHGIVRTFKNGEETLCRMGPYGVKNTIWFLNFKALQEVLFM